MMTPVSILQDRLTALGLPVVSVVSTGRIIFADGATDKQKTDAQKIVDALDLNDEEALLKKRQQYKRLAELKAAKSEADIALDAAASAEIQKEIDAL